MLRAVAMLSLLILLAAPGPARTEAARVHRIGYLSPWFSTSDPVQRLALLEGLRTRGYREGEEFVFESRYAEGRLGQLPELAAQLVERKVDVLIAVSTLAGLAAKAATTSIPIVVASGGDMLASGLVADPARPGGNVTGIQLLSPELALRQLEIITQLVPGATRLAFFGNPDLPSEIAFFNALERRAASSRRTVRLVPVKAEADYRVAFLRLVEERVQALLVGASATQLDPSRSIVRLMAQNKIPALYPGRQFVEAGGLTSYFAHPGDQGRLVATYVDKIFRGARPGDLPVEQYTKYELVINLRTARTLGLTIPSALREQAASLVP